MKNKPWQQSVTKAAAKARQYTENKIETIGLLPEVLREEKRAKKGNA